MLYTDEDVQAVIEVEQTRTDTTDLTVYISSIRDIFGGVAGYSVHAEDESSSYAYHNFNRGIPKNDGRTHRKVRRILRKAARRYATNTGWRK